MQLRERALRWPVAQTCRRAFYVFRKPSRMSPRLVFYFEPQSRQEDPGIECLGDDPPLLQCRPAPSHPGAYLHPPKRKLRVAYSVGHMCETFPQISEKPATSRAQASRWGEENRLPCTRDLQR